MKYLIFIFLGVQGAKCLPNLVLGPLSADKLDALTGLAGEKVDLNVDKKGLNVERHHKEVEETSDYSQNNTQTDVNGSDFNETSSNNKSHTSKGVKETERDQGLSLGSGGLNFFDEKTVTEDKTTEDNESKNSRRVERKATPMSDHRESYSSTYDKSTKTHDRHEGHERRGFNLGGGRIGVDEEESTKDKREVEKRESRTEYKKIEDSKKTEHGKKKYVSPQKTEFSHQSKDVTENSSFKNESNTDDLDSDDYYPKLGPPILHQISRMDRSIDGKNREHSKPNFEYFDQQAFRNSYIEKLRKKILQANQEAEHEVLSSQKKEPAKIMPNYNQDGDLKNKVQFFRKISDNFESSTPNFDHFTKFGHPYSYQTYSIAENDNFQKLSSDRQRFPNTFGYSSYGPGGFSFGQTGTSYGDIGTTYEHRGSKHSISPSYEHAEAGYKNIGSIDEQSGSVNQNIRSPYELSGFRQKNEYSIGHSGSSGKTKSIEPIIFDYENSRSGYEHSRSGYKHIGSTIKPKIVYVTSGYDFGNSGSSHGNSGSVYEHAVSDYQHIRSTIRPSGSGHKYTVSGYMHIGSTMKPSESGYKNSGSDFRNGGSVYEYTGPDYEHIIIKPNGSGNENSGSGFQQAGFGYKHGGSRRAYPDTFIGPDSAIEPSVHRTDTKNSRPIYSTERYRDDSHYEDDKGLRYISPQNEYSTDFSGLKSSHRSVTDDGTESEGTENSYGTRTKGKNHGQNTDYKSEVIRPEIISASHKTYTIKPVSDNSGDHFDEVIIIGQNNAPVNKHLNKNQKERDFIEELETEQKNEGKHTILVDALKENMKNRYEIIKNEAENNKSDKSNEIFESNKTSTNTNGSTNNNISDRPNNINDALHKKDKLYHDYDIPNQKDNKIDEEPIDSSSDEDGNLEYGIEPMDLFDNYDDEEFNTYSQTANPEVYTKIYSINNKNDDDDFLTADDKTIENNNNNNISYSIIATKLRRLISNNIMRITNLHNKIRDRLLRPVVNTLKENEPGESSDQKSIETQKLQINHKNERIRKATQATSKDSTSLKNIETGSGDCEHSTDGDSYYNKYNSTNFKHNNSDSNETTGLTATEISSTRDKATEILNLDESTTKKRRQTYDIDLKQEEGFKLLGETTVKIPRIEGIIIKNKKIQVPVLALTEKPANIITKPDIPVVYTNSTKIKHKQDTRSTKPIKEKQKVTKAVKSRKKSRKYINNKKRLIDEDFKSITVSHEVISDIVSREIDNTSAHKTALLLASEFHLESKQNSKFDGIELYESITINPIKDSLKNTGESDVVNLTYYDKALEKLSSSKTTVPINFRGIRDSTTSNSLNDKVFKQTDNFKKITFLSLNGNAKTTTEKIYKDLQEKTTTKHFKLKSHKQRKLHKRIKSKNKKKAYNITVDQGSNIEQTNLTLLNTTNETQRKKPKPTVHDITTEKSLQYYETQKVFPNKITENQTDENKEQIKVNKISEHNYKNNDNRVDSKDINNDETKDKKTDHLKEKNKNNKDLQDHLITKSEPSIRPISEETTKPYGNDERKSEYSTKIESVTKTSTEKKIEISLNKSFHIDKKNNNNKDLQDHLITKSEHSIRPISEETTKPYNNNEINSEYSTIIESVTKISTEERLEISLEKSFLSDLKDIKNSSIIKEKDNNIQTKSTNEDGEAMHGQIDHHPTLKTPEFQEVDANNPNLEDGRNIHELINNNTKKNSTYKGEQILETQKDKMSNRNEKNVSITSETNDEMSHEHEKDNMKLSDKSIRNLKEKPDRENGDKISHENVTNDSKINKEMSQKVEHGIQEKPHNNKNHGDSQMNSKQNDRILFVPKKFESLLNDDNLFKNSPIFTIDQNIFHEHEQNKSKVKGKIPHTDFREKNVKTFDEDEKNKTKSNSTDDSYEGENNSSHKQEINNNSSTRKIKHTNKGKKHKENHSNRNNLDFQENYDKLSHEREIINSSYKKTKQKTKLVQTSQHQNDKHVDIHENHRKRHHERRKINQRLFKHISNEGTLEFDEEIPHKIVKHEKYDKSPDEKQFNYPKNDDIEPYEKYPQLIKEPYYERIFKISDGLFHERENKDKLDQGNYKKPERLLNSRSDNDTVIIADEKTNSNSRKKNKEGSYEDPHEINNKTSVESKKVNLMSNEGNSQRIINKTNGIQLDLRKNDDNTSNKHLKNDSDRTKIRFELKHSKKSGRKLLDLLKKDNNKHQKNKESTSEKVNSHGYYNARYNKTSGRRREKKAYEESHEKGDTTSRESFESNWSKITHEIIPIGKTKRNHHRNERQASQEGDYASHREKYNSQLTERPYRNTNESQDKDKDPKHRTERQLNFSYDYDSVDEENTPTPDEQKDKNKPTNNEHRIEKYFETRDLDGKKSYNIEKIEKPNFTHNTTRSEIEFLKHEGKKSSVKDDIFVNNYTQREKTSSTNQDTNNNDLKKNKDRLSETIKRKEIAIDISKDKRKDKKEVTKPMEERGYKHATDQRRRKYHIDDNDSKNKSRKNEEKSSNKSHKSDHENKNKNHTSVSKNNGYRGTKKPQLKNIKDANEGNNKTTNKVVKSGDSKQIKSEQEDNNESYEDYHESFKKSEEDDVYDLK